MSINSFINSSNYSSNMENIDSSDIKYQLRSTDNSNMTIFYITIGIIILLIVFWLVFMFFTSGTSLDLLSVMNDPSSQIEPASDSINKSQIPSYYTLPNN